MAEDELAGLDVAPCDPVVPGNALAGHGVTDALDRGLAVSVGPAEVLAPVRERHGILAVQQTQPMQLSVAEQARDRRLEGRPVDLAARGDRHEDVRPFGTEALDPHLGRARTDVAEHPRGAMADRFDEGGGQLAQDGAGDPEGSQPHVRERDVRRRRRWFVPMLGGCDLIDDLAQERAPGLRLGDLEEQVGDARKPVAAQNVSLDVRQPERSHVPDSCR